MEIVLDELRGARRLSVQIVGCVYMSRDMICARVLESEQCSS